MPIVDVAGAKVYIEDTGAPDSRPEAPVVVFGHGLLFSGRMFAAQVERLRGQYRCVTIDWRGQGRSPAAPTGYDMDTLADDATAIIEGLDAGPVHYVGLSMGGFVGMRLAARRPELLRSLTLLDTSAGPEDPDKVSTYRTLAKVYRVLGLGPVRSRVEPIMFGPTFLASSGAKQHTEAWMAEVKACKRSGLARAIYGVTDRSPIQPELGDITTPTLVVVGDEDVATPPAKAEVIAASIAGSRLEIVNGSGHSSTIEQPERLGELIEAFIAQH